MPTGMSGDNGGEITTKFYGLRTKARRSRRFYDLKKNDSRQRRAETWLCGGDRRTSAWQIA